MAHTLSCLYTPERNKRSTRSDLGMGLRICRGDRVLGVEAGELGSGGSSGWGYPLWTSTSEAHMRHTLCRQGSTIGCFTMSLHTGHSNSCSILFILDWKKWMEEEKKGDEWEKDNRRSYKYLQWNTIIKNTTCATTIKDTLLTDTTFFM